MPQLRGRVKSISNKFLSRTKADFQDMRRSARNEVRDTHELIRENVRSFTRYEPMSDKALAGNAAAAVIGTVFVVGSAKQLSGLFKGKAELVAEKAQASEETAWVHDIKIGRVNEDIGGAFATLLLVSLATAAFLNRVRLQAQHRFKESKKENASQGE